MGPWSFGFSCCDIMRNPWRSRNIFAYQQTGDGRKCIFFSFNPHECIKQNTRYLLHQYTYNLKAYCYRSRKTLSLRDIHCTSLNLCTYFVSVVSWPCINWFYLCSAGFLYWHWGNHTIAQYQWINPDEYGKINHMDHYELTISLVQQIFVHIWGDIETDIRHDLNLVVSGGTASCHNGKPRCHYWWQRWHHGNSRFCVYVIMAMEKGNIELMVKLQVFTYIHDQSVVHRQFTPDTRQSV